jgi:hypothetical protein
MFKMSCKPYIELLNSRKKRWNDIAKDKPTLHDFLKKFIHNKKIKE